VRLFMPRVIRGTLQTHFGAGAAERVRDRVTELHRRGPDARFEIADHGGDASTRAVGWRKQSRGERAAPKAAALYSAAL